MLKQRVLTAAILVPVVVASILLLSVAEFAIAAGIFVLVAAWEWAELSFLHASWQKGLYVLLIASLLLFAWHFSIEVILYFTLAFWIFNAFLVLTHPRFENGWHRHHSMMILSGIMVLMPFWLALVILKSEQQGIYWLGFIVALIAGADISAYFAGKQWGKRKLIPRVSPGKTRVGLLASVLWAVIFSLVCCWWMAAVGIEIVLLVFTAVFIVLVSILGDLYESMMKRIRGVKDSGTILPGHGGILDRIDSLTAALPLFVVLLEVGDQLL